jgi:transcription initiation factor TFIIH subunit 1
MFISPQAQATTERETFKKELTNIIGANRAVKAVTPSGTVAAASGSTSKTTPSTPNPMNHAQAGLTPQSQTASASRAGSMAPSTRASSMGPVGAPEDFAVRKRVLMKNPDLASLHRELVMTGQITEAEFWEGREVSIILVQRNFRELKLVSVVYVAS